MYTYLNMIMYVYTHIYIYILYTYALIENDASNSFSPSLHNYSIVGSLQGGEDP